MDALFAVGGLAVPVVFSFAVWANVRKVPVRVREWWGREPVDLDRMDGVWREGDER